MYYECVNTVCLIKIIDNSEYKHKQFKSDIQLI